MDSWLPSAGGPIHRPQFRLEGFVSEGNGRSAVLVHYDEAVKIKGDGIDNGEKVLPPLNVLHQFPCVAVNVCS